MKRKRQQLVDRNEYAVVVRFTFNYYYFFHSNFTVRFSFSLSLLD